MKNEIIENKVLSLGRKTAMGLALSGLLLVSGGLPSKVEAADSSTDPKQNMTVGLKQWFTDISILRDSLSKTVSSLEALKAANESKAELAKPYAAFSGNLNELDALVIKLRERGTATKARAKEHWAAWQTELTAMQNAKLREKAQSRFSAMQKEFQKIQEKVDAAKEVFAPLMADLKDVDTYLKVDLSSESLDSLSGNIWKMGKTSQKVDGKLMDVYEQFDRVLKKMPQT